MSTGPADPVSQLWASVSRGSTGRRNRRLLSPFDHPRFGHRHPCFKEALGTVLVLMFIKPLAVVPIFAHHPARLRPRWYPPDGRAPSRPHRARPRLDNVPLEHAVRQLAWLLFGAALLAILAHRLRIPYAVALVLGGLLIAESPIASLPRL